jgi:hypothetical protein
MVDTRGCGKFIRATSSLYISAVIALEKTLYPIPQMRINNNKKNIAISAFFRFISDLDHNFVLRNKKRIEY